MKNARVPLIVFLALGLTLGLLWVLEGFSHSAPAGRDLAFAPRALSRQHDPVIIPGGLLSELSGSPLEELFVYAYQGTTATQIPFQIDERDAGGMYVAVEDGQLDGNDELVFMAADGGDRVANPELDVGGTVITPTYVITLTDPLDDAHAWAYVYRSADLVYAAVGDYVAYDGGNDRLISSGRYAVGFNATYAFRDYLTLGDSSLDLLDRDKLRITGTATIPPFPPFTVAANEQDVTKTGVHAIDGPVRVTRVSTGTFSVAGQQAQATITLFAYRSLVVQPATVQIPGPPVQVDHLRLSMDWNAAAAGITHYDANNPAGVTIDGVPDALTLTPAARWTQVTSSTGTLVNVTGIPAGIGGSQSTYYEDDSSVDSGDTGDQRSYGDAGFQVENPNADTYTILGQMYFLTGTTTNVGATYVNYYDHPLQVDVAVYTPAPAWISLTPVGDAAAVSPGETAVYTLTLTASEGYAEPVTLTLQGAPAGTNAAFYPPSVIPPDSSRLHVTTTASTLAGTYAMTVTGSSGVLTDTARLTLMVDLAEIYLPLVLK